MRSRSTQRFSQITMFYIPSRRVTLTIRRKNSILAVCIHDPILSYPKFTVMDDDVEINISKSLSYLPYRKFPIWQPWSDICINFYPSGVQVTLSLPSWVTCICKSTLHGISLGKDLGISSNFCRIFFLSLRKKSQRMSFRVYSIWCLWNPIENPYG